TSCFGAGGGSFFFFFFFDDDFFGGVVDGGVVADVPGAGVCAGAAGARKRIVAASETRVRRGNGAPRNRRDAFDTTFRGADRQRPDSEQIAAPVLEGRQVAADLRDAGGVELGQRDAFALVAGVGEHFAPRVDDAGVAPGVTIFVRRADP